MFKYFFFMFKKGFHVCSCSLMFSMFSMSSSQWRVLYMFQPSKHFEHVWTCFEHALNKVETCQTCWTCLNMTEHERKIIAIFTVNFMFSMFKHFEHALNKIETCQTCWTCLNMTKHECIFWTWKKNIWTCSMFKMLKTIEHAETCSERLKTRL